mgnify:CR=1 FL=1
MIWVFYIAIVVAICLTAIYAQKRKTGETFETRYEPPVKIERNDFPGKNADALVVLFTSKVCNSCENVISKASVLQSGEVDVVNVEFEDAQGKKLHSKYQIEAVPTLVICDINGVVSKSFVGPVTATDLWAEVARLRGADIEKCSDHKE